MASWPHVQSVVISQDSASQCVSFIYTSFLYVFVPWKIWKVDPQAEQEIQQGQDVGVGQSCHLSPFEQSFFLQVKIYMKVDLHMVGCRQFAGVRRLA
jgi:hypothetical protein